MCFYGRGEGKEKPHISLSKASHTSPPNRKGAGNVEAQMECLLSMNVSVKSTPHRDFPSGLVVKTSRSQCRGHGFDPWLGNFDPACRMALPKKKKKE